jgi:hypothetical protein
MKYGNFVFWLLVLQPNKTRTIQRLMAGSHNNLLVKRRSSIRSKCCLVNIQELTFIP